MRYQGAIVQEVVLSNVASKYFCFVNVCRVGFQCLIRFALAGGAIGASIDAVLEGFLNVAVSEHHFPGTLGLALQPLDPLYGQVSGVTRLVNNTHV